MNESKKTVENLKGETVMPSGKIVAWMETASTIKIKGKEFFVVPKKAGGAQIQPGIVSVRERDLSFNRRDYNNKDFPWARVAVTESGKEIVVIPCKEELADARIVRRQKRGYTVIINFPKSARRFIENKLGKFPTGHFPFEQQANGVFYISLME